jgi:hypothetical protein
MSHWKSSSRRLAASLGLVIAIMLIAPALLAAPGCAQAESSNWAQTSPLIDPEKRVEASYHLSAHAEVAKAEVDELHDELNGELDDELDGDERRVDAGRK